MLPSISVWLSTRVKARGFAKFIIHPLVQAILGVMSIELECRM
jgi:hypothetical protein